jgi:hypothetical protein
MKCGLDRIINSLQDHLLSSLDTLDTRKFDFNSLPADSKISMYANLSNVYSQTTTDMADIPVLKSKVKPGRRPKS